MIKYLKNKEIDKQKWDACINDAANGLIYGYSWYLDIIAEKWDALIYDDYSAVMPLTRKSKFGIKYLIQPVYMQQAGIFFKQKLSETELENFINHIPKKFKKITINLNSENLISKLNLTKIACRSRGTEYNPKVIEFLFL